MTTVVTQLRINGLVNEPCLTEPNRTAVSNTHDGLKLNMSPAYCKTMVLPPEEDTHMSMDTHMSTGGHLRPEELVKAVVLLRIWKP